MRPRLTSDPEVGRTESVISPSPDTLFNPENRHEPSSEYRRYAADAAIPRDEAAASRRHSLLRLTMGMKLVQAWIEIHRDDLLADWKLAVAGEPVFKIEPLR